MKLFVVKACAATVLVGTSTLAAAQAPTPAETTARAPTRAETFASQFAQMQALSSTSTYAFKSPPVLRAQADDPIGHESFAEAFDRMQAASSSSGRFKDLAHGGQTAYSKAGSAEDIGKPTLAQRWARLMHRSSPGAAPPVN